MLQSSVICYVGFSALQGLREEASFHTFFEKDDLKLPKKEKFRAIMRMEKLL